MIHHEVLGRHDAPTVLLSSGLGGLGAYWKPQLAALTGRYRVILYDQAGTGRSKATLADPYSISAMADDVAAILGNTPCHFIGHALGGLVGLDLALRHPHLLTSLVLVNAWAQLDSHTQRCFAVRTAILRDSGVEAYVRAQPIFLHPAAWLSQHAARLVEEEAHGITHFQGAETLLRRIGALRAFDVVDRLGTIRTRTLVMATRDDMLVPWTCSQVLQAGIPNAEVVVSETGGHASNVTDPASFNTQLLRFLDAMPA